VWKIAREITGYRKKTGNRSIGDIQGCNSTLDKCKKCNTFYNEIAPKLASQLPPAESDFKVYLPDTSEIVVIKRVLAISLRQN
jgi:hypothetical protein